MGLKSLDDELVEQQPHVESHGLHAHGTDAFEVVSLTLNGI